PWHAFLRRGLITAISHPQTVLFFISILSVTLNPETPTSARLLARAGIVLASIIWRVFLLHAFSLLPVRSAYRRMTRAACQVIGAFVCVFALCLIYERVT
uniref:LysE family transporter n=1 Tax=Escherichia coli TaxID=562 RepID=UPI00164A0CBC